MWFYITTCTYINYILCTFQYLICLVLSLLVLIGGTVWCYIYRHQVTHKHVLTYNSEHCSMVFSSPEPRLMWAILLKICRMSVIIASQTFHISVYYSRTARPISTKLSKMTLWVKGIQVCSNEGSHHFSKGR